MEKFDELIKELRARSMIGCGSIADPLRLGLQNRFSAVAKQLRKWQAQFKIVHESGNFQIYPRNFLTWGDMPSAGDCVKCDVMGRLPLPDNCEPCRTKCFEQKLGCSRHYVRKYKSNKGHGIVEKDCGLGKIRDSTCLFDKETWSHGFVSQNHLGII